MSYVFPIDIVNKLRKLNWRVYKTDMPSIFAMINRHAAQNEIDGFCEICGREVEYPSLWCEKHLHGVKG